MRGIYIKMIIAVLANTGVRWKRGATKEKTKNCWLVELKVKVSLSTLWMSGGAEVYLCLFLTPALIRQASTKNASCNSHWTCSSERTSAKYGSVQWRSILQILLDGDWNSAAYHLLLRGTGSTALQYFWETVCWTKRSKHSLTQDLCLFIRDTGIMNLCWTRV
jgi:hypothetical protein